VAASYDGATSHPREDPYYPAKGDPRFDALHYGLDLRWAPAVRRLHGTATIRFRAMRDTSALQLDLGHPLTVSSVRLDGHRIRSTHPHNHLNLQTGPLVRRSRHTLRITYAGTPRPVRAPTTRSDLVTVGWTTTRSRSVWTMQEPFGAFTWYPVNDHPSDKALYDARIDAPGRWVGIFNGDLRSRTRQGGRTVTRWHLASPAASYLITIAIGNYVHRSDTGPHGLPITYWVPASRTRLVRPLRDLPSMVGWLESKLGRYPFDRIGAVVVPSDSAMETQTLLTMGRQAYHRSDFRQVILHELAHQWYGDTVTPNNWKDLWLNESFAMYTQVQWAAHHGDLPWSYWVSYWKANDQRWRNQDGPPGAYDRGEFGDICVYYCGALMLRELRAKVGPVTFDAALRRWVQRRHNTNADRGRYISWLDHFTGRSFGPWIRHWLTARTSPASR
jgi:aminopeptidase N